MKIFISWSGEFSRITATLLKKYVPAILQGVDPFVSAHDIESGSRWGAKLTTELNATNYGIICLNPDNLNSHWIMFEAGALSKFEEGAVCGLLFGDLKPTDVKSPLSQFQHRTFNKDDFKTLLSDINKRLPSSVAFEQFEILFSSLWPKIESEYSQLLITQSSPNTISVKRDQVELLEEVLFRLRNLERANTQNLLDPSLSVDELMNSPVTDQNLKLYTNWKFPEKEISVHWQNQLLSDLLIQNYPTIRHIDTVVSRARDAVEQYEQEQPEVFSTGTDHITKSLGFVDSSFQRTHSWSDKTIRAFEKFSHLVRSNADIEVI